MGTKYSGSNWIKSNSYGKTISPFGEVVADLLGDLFLGIYHVADDARRVNWSDPNHIRFSTYAGGQFATYDSDLLTRLVWLCHDRCVRCEIGPSGPKYLAFMFHPRKRESEGIWGRQPTWEAAGEKLRNHYGTREGEQDE